MSYHRVCCCSQPEAGYLCVPEGSDEECSATCSLRIVVPAVDIRHTQPFNDPGNGSWSGYCTTTSNSWTSTFDLFADVRMATGELCTGGDSCECFYVGINTKHSFYSTDDFLNSIPEPYGTQVSAGSWFGDEVWEGSCCNKINDSGGFCRASQDGSSYCGLPATLDCVEEPTNVCCDDGQCWQKANEVYDLGTCTETISGIGHAITRYASVWPECGSACGSNQPDGLPGTDVCTSCGDGFNRIACCAAMGSGSKGCLPNGQANCIGYTHYCDNAFGPVYGCNETGCQTTAGKASYSGCTGTLEFGKLWYDQVEGYWYLFAGFHARAGYCEKQWNIFNVGDFNIDTEYQQYIPNTYESAFNYGGNACDPCTSSSSCTAPTFGNTCSCDGCGFACDAYCTAAYQSSCFVGSGNASGLYGTSWRLPEGWSPCGGGGISNTSSGVQVACRYFGFDYEIPSTGPRRKYGDIGWVESGFEISWNLTPS